MPGRFGRRFGPRRRRAVAAVQGGGPTSPTTFFTSSEAGMVWDLSNFANLYQTIDGTTTAVTATGQSVGYVKDLSPNANHWKAAANDTTRPTLQQDSDGKYYLSFDGSNDVLLAPVPFVAATSSATLAFTSVVGIFAAAQSATKTLLSTGSTSNAVPFMVPLQASGTTTSLVSVGRNDASNGSTTNQWPTLTSVLDSTKRVITSAYAGPTVGTNRMRDGASRPSGGGTGSYASSANTNCVTPLSLTRSGLGANCPATIANFFAGRIYSGFVINRYLTDNEVKTAEDWVASKCLASTLP
jgi:hypothetical protein